MTVRLYVEYPSGYRELHDLDHFTANPDGSVTAVIATPTGEAPCRSTPKCPAPATR